MSSRLVGLAQLTFLDLTPPQLIELAAAADFDAVSLRLSPAGPDDHPARLTDDPGLRRDTQTALRATGVSVLDVEVLVLEETTDPGDFMPVLDAAAQLGAHHLLVNSRDPSVNRLLDHFAALGELAAPLGLTPVLEHIPYTALRTLREARGVAAAAGGGIVVDALHLARSGEGPGDVAGLPAGLVRYLQLCDGPAHPPADLVTESRTARRAPGDGDFPLTDLLRAAPDGVPLSIEAPSDVERARHGDVVWARRLRAAADDLLASVRQDAAGPHRDVRGEQSPA